MGIRMALGAGVAVGLLVSLAATRVLTSLLFRTPATGAVTYVGVAFLIVTVGLVAAWVPAWRASSANPAHTLRSD